MKLYNNRTILIEKYIPPIEINLITGDKVWYNKYGEFHSINNQPALLWYNSGRLSAALWFKNGLQHRDGDKPAQITYNENGEEKKWWWYKNNKLHRDFNKPAFIGTYGYLNTTYHLEYFKNGMFIKKEFKNK